MDNATLKKIAIDTVDNGNFDLSVFDTSGPYWRKYASRFNDFLIDGTPRFTIITKGNGKLPFYCYSTLPGINCPGAGECLTWCYSFKAWRYPAAFFRQLQNTILERYAQDHIAQAFNKLPNNAIFRLYVDGDLNSHNIDFWIASIKASGDVRVYGYSKSIDLILEHADHWPKNYLLNQSGGNNASDRSRDLFSDLPFVRGKFIARKVSVKLDANKIAAREYRIETGKRKVYACPGKCGKCMANGDHACGTSAMQGVDILIGIH